MDSFCKMIVEDNHSTSKLRIPPDFLNNYEKISTQSSNTVTLKIDDESGKLWKVGVEQIGDFHFFTKGWPKFAEEVGLQLRDFLIFKLVDETSFHVSVFDTTGCNKDYLSSDDEDEDEEEEEVKDGETGSEAEKKWSFSKQVKHHHLRSNRMDMPKAFVAGTGIVNKGEIILEDGKGRKWPIKVTVRNKGTIYGMTAGWKNFVVANGVKIGSIIFHEFVSANLDMPKAFVVGTEIKKKGEIILEDGKDSKWVVKVTLRNRGLIYGMTAGWKSFVVANGAKIGSIISHDFVSANLVPAHIIHETKLIISD